MWKILQRKKLMSLLFIHVHIAPSAPVNSRVSNLSMILIYLENYSMTDNPLARIPVITQAILDAQPLEFHADNIGKLGAYLRYLAGKLDATIELKNDAAEAQLRICRNAGLRFPEIAKRGGNGSNQYGSKEQMESYKPLADYGFKKYRANLCRKIAAIPEELFENEIMSIRTTEHITGREITTTYFIDKVYAIECGSTNSVYQHTPQTIAALARRHLSAHGIARLVQLLTIADKDKNSNG